MPDPRDDLVRRGDVLDMIDAESHGDEGLAIIDSRDILALPADPVAAAAVALAEELVKDIDDFACAVEFYITLETKEALSAYRAAIAGRERGR